MPPAAPSMPRTASVPLPAPSTWHLPCPGILESFRGLGRNAIVGAAGRGWRCGPRRTRGGPESRCRSCRCSRQSGMRSGWSRGTASPRSRRRGVPCCCPPPSSGNTLPCRMSGVALHPSPSGTPSRRPAPPPGPGAGCRGSLLAEGQAQRCGRAAPSSRRASAPARPRACTGWRSGLRRAVASRASPWGAHAGAFRPSRPRPPPLRGRAGFAPRP
mmetsp:Transcript_32677/g.77470  ORF Transcript_32677/g.77470 Transcript_32677/m.77470 type:complete len:215 (-) Transcript_32677:1202-1846(-)